MRNIKSVLEKGRIHQKLKYDNDSVFRELKREYARRKNKEMRLLSPDKLREKERLKHSRRRARIKGSISDSNKVIKEHLLKSKNVCYWCGIKITKKTSIHIDHVTPLARGGLNTAGNLVKSCAKCNQTKNAKPLSEVSMSNGQMVFL